MPVKAKDLAEEQTHLQLSHVAGVDAVFHEPTINQDSVVKFIAPKTYAAKKESEQLKEKHNTHRLWLENIMKQKAALQLNQQKMQTKVAEKRKSGNPLSGLGF